MSRRTHTRATDSRGARTNSTCEPAREILLASQRAWAHGQFGLAKCWAPMFHLNANVIHGWPWVRLQAASIWLVLGAAFGRVNLLFLLTFAFCFCFVVVVFTFTFRSSQDAGANLHAPNLRPLALWLSGLRLVCYRPAAVGELKTSRWGPNFRC